jgi:hypothetical protein
MKVLRPLFTCVPPETEFLGPARVRALRCWQWVRGDIRAFGHSSIKCDWLWSDAPKFKYTSNPTWCAHQRWLTAWREVLDSKGRREVIHCENLRRRGSGPCPVKSGPDIHRIRNASWNPMKRTGLRVVYCRWGHRHRSLSARLVHTG